MRCLRLKRVVFVLFCVAVLCLTVSAGTVGAYKEGYTRDSFGLKNAVTLDGKWTTGIEWEEGYLTNFGTNVSFKNKGEIISYTPPDVWEYIIVESLDNTDDAGDYWQICFTARFQTTYQFQVLLPHSLMIYC